MRTLTATFLSFLLTTQLAPAIFAESKGDWTAVKALANLSVAVSTTTGETHFGLLQTVGDTSLELRIAGSDDFTGQEIVIPRAEVLKVWRAQLRFGQKNIGKGALIGAGAGLGVAFITAGILGAQHSEDPPVGLGAFPIYGAGAGAVAGKFWRKGHKKEHLIYSV